MTGTTSPAVVVTLDDGPDPVMTPRMLEVLARHEATATFFVLLTRVRREDVLREVIAAGHEVALHGPDHRALSEFSGETWGGAPPPPAAELEAVTGSAVRWFRPPYGARRRRLAGRPPRGARPRALVGDHLGLEPCVTDEHRLAQAMARVRAGGDPARPRRRRRRGDRVDDGPAPAVDRAALAGRVMDAMAERSVGVVSLVRRWSTVTPSALRSFGCIEPFIR